MTGWVCDLLQRRQAFAEGRAATCFEEVDVAAQVVGEFGVEVGQVVGEAGADVLVSGQALAAPLLLLADDPLALPTPVTPPRSNQVGRPMQVAVAGPAGPGVVTHPGEYITQLI